MDDIPWGFITVAVVIALLLGWSHAKEWHEWEQFKADNGCKIVGFSRGSTAPMIGFDGKFGMGIENDKVAWECNNGITYWR